MMLFPPLDCPSPDALAAALPPNTRWVECVLGDLGSVARGKRVHRDDFVQAQGCKLPSVALGLTLTAGEPAELFGPWLSTRYADLHLVPDLHTLAPRHGRPGEVTVLCEPTGPLGGERPADARALSPRAALRHVLAQLAAQGLQAWVAPEMELFLLDPGPEGLTAARGRPGAPARERACEAFSLERATHFEAYFDELYAACEAQGIPLNGHAHESAWSQYEVNFRPGPALAQADAVFRFKRLARECAQRHGFLASFAAKPFLDQPGTGMHWHVSLRPSAAEAGAWPHLFGTPDGGPSAALMHFVAGLQAHAPAAMAVFAPYDMSFDRILRADAAPTHASWGLEARDLAFRLPAASSAAAQRVENRLPGGDANPYLVLALTLGLGARGLAEGRLPVDGPGQPLPRSLADALAAMAGSEVVRAVLGEPLVAAYVGIKQHESAERHACADPRAHWDLVHLLEQA